MRAAVDALTTLEGQLAIGSGSATKRNDRLRMAGGATGASSGDDIEAEIEALIEEFGPHHDYGFAF